MSFPTPLLDRKLAELRQQSERDRQQLLQTALTWLQHHAAQFEIEQGYLFGSITQPGKFSPQSDLDLAVECLSQGYPFGLSSYLSLHVNREVDIVPLDQCHFAAKIRQTGMPWSTSKPSGDPYSGSILLSRSTGYIFFNKSPKGFASK
jgi:uncharacterized protein